MLHELFPLLVTNGVALLLIFIIAASRSVLLRLRLTIVATIASLLLWQDAIAVANRKVTDLELWNSMVFLWPTAAAVCLFLFLHYVHASVGNKNLRLKPLERVMYRVFMVMVSLQLLMVASLGIFRSVTIDQAGGLVLSRSAGYYVYVFAFTVSLFLICTKLIMSIRASGYRSQEWYALRTILYTIGSASIFGIIVSIIIPVLANSQSYISLGLVAVNMFSFGLAFSIFEQRLLDVKMYIVRVVTYGLSLLALAVLYIVMSFIVSRSILGQTASAANTSINVFLTLLLAFLFQPIKHFFDKITNQFFYRDNYNTDDFFARLSRILTSTTDLTKLLTSAAKEIEQALKSEDAFFAVCGPKGQQMLVGVDTHESVSVNDIRKLGQYIKTEQSIEKVIVTELLSAGSSLRKELTSHKIVVVLPLIVSDNVIAYLFLGEHRSGHYTGRDIKTLSTVSDELVIAIQNSLSVEEIKELNATLQARVDEATKELRASNAKLQRLDEVKDEFVSIASHQLRTPLTSVKGYISMVLEGDAGDISPMQRKLLDQAFSSSQRMVSLINDFLNVSRLKNGKFVLEIRSVNLAKVVDEEVESLRSTANSKHIALAYKQPAYYPTLKLDEDKIRQVVVNFIDNAIHYSDDGTTIQVKLSVSDGEAMLEVIDNGIGVPVGERAHLFTKFFRATNARRQRPDGTGVGLFLAKKIVTAHGGSIVFTSAEGKGSTFGFRLPIKKLSGDGA